MEAGYYLVVIRRDLGPTIREEADKIDGFTFFFEPGWIIENRHEYAGEIAMLPRDPTYPTGAPAWISSGDLHCRCHCPMCMGPTSRPLQWGKVCHSLAIAGVETFEVVPVASLACSISMSIDDCVQREKENAGEKKWNSDDDGEDIHLLHWIPHRHFQRAAPPTFIRWNCSAARVANSCSLIPILAFTASSRVAKTRQPG